MLQHTALLLLSLLCVGIASAELRGSATVMTNPDYSVSWVVNDANDTITITLELDMFAWVGVGWHVYGSSDSDMQYADIVVGEFDADQSNTQNSKFSVQDYYCNVLGTQPTLDPEWKPPGVDNIVPIYGVQYNKYGVNTTVITFQRALVTGDLETDNDIVLGEMPFIFAHGTSNVFGFHSDYAIEYPIDLLSGGTQAPPPGAPSGSPPSGSAPVSSLTLQYWHGALMTIAFGFFLSIGVFLPRYMKSFWWWFPLHIALQVTGVILSIIAFTLVVISVDKGNHFRILHAWFGLATLLFAFASPILGTIAHFMWNASRSGIPVFPDQVHWWIGRACIILSWVTIFLGMLYQPIFKVPVEIVFAFALVLVTYIGTYIWLDVMKIKEIGFRAYFFGTQIKHSHPRDVTPLISDY